MELKASQERFEQKVASLISPKGKSKRLPFVLPDYLKDIATERPMPPVDTVKEDIE